MVFYFFTFIVFLAELIIAIVILVSLFKWDKIFRETNNFFEEAQPKIKGILQTIRKISVQLTELAPIWVDTLRDAVYEFLINQSKNILTGILAWMVSKQVEKVIVEKVSRL